MYVLVISRCKNPFELVDGHDTVEDTKTSAAKRHRVQNGCVTTLFQHVSTTNIVAYFIMNEEQKTLNDVKK